jgi:SAM-dependent methyltransferase
VALELEEDRVARLRARFAGQPNVHAEVGDLSDPSLLRLAPYGFDTVICLNVLEHIERHVEALTHMHALLVPGGRLLLLVPAHPSLYSRLDSELGHYRRYADADLRALLQGVGFRIERRFYLNLFGIFGWWLNGRILQRRILPRGQLGLYERLAPAFRAVEEGLGRRWGLSIVFIAQKM